MTLQYVWSAASSLVSKDPVALIGTAPGTNTSAYRLVGYGSCFNASFETKVFFGKSLSVLVNGRAEGAVAKWLERRTLISDEDKPIISHRPLELEQPKSK